MFEDEKVDVFVGVLGMICVGCIISMLKDERDFTLSAREVSRVARLQLKFGKEFVIVVVSMFEDEDDNWQVFFEVFQLSDVVMKVQECGWFIGECGVDEDGDELKGVFKFMNEVIVCDGLSINDVNVVDNDMFFVIVLILDYEGAILITFFVENRLYFV